MKTKETWLRYWQEEVDAAHLYAQLAKDINDRKKKDRYLKLSSVEQKHVAAWEQLLKDQGVTLPRKRPSSKARFKYWLTPYFGLNLLEKMMLQEEAKEVKSYLNLHKTATDDPTRTIALNLARDSARHAENLTDILSKDGEPWHKTGSGGILRDIIYGFNDGLTANFGLIAGIIGARTNNDIILISGLAGLLADALSMGASGYLAAKSEKEVQENERQMEADEIMYMPEIETEELALIYESKGMQPEAARDLAVEIMKDKDRALEEKVSLELGFSAHPINPLQEAWLTGSATAVGALIPVLPFFFWEGTVAMVISFTFAMLAHFGVGAARSVFTGRSFFRSGFDMFIVGFGVAGIGYMIGELVLKFL